METLRDRWQILVNGSPSIANTDDTGDDGNYSATLNDLDLESLKLILSIKSEQEEVSDFSFSFNQGHESFSQSVCCWTLFGKVGQKVWNFTESHKYTILHSGQCRKWDKFLVSYPILRPDKYLYL